MKRLVALMICAVSLVAAAQSTITYPYNPDGNADALIGVTDLQDMLSTYGGAFSPSEILLDGETLTTVLTQMQNSIDSLSGLTGGGGSVLDMPLGTVLPIATESVPEGWMLCDGREISIEDYQGLYDLIGTTYGAGDSAFWAQVYYPATTFNIPDLRGRTIIGANDMGGEQSGVLTIHQASAGQVGGEEMHQLTEAEMPCHSHQVIIEGWDFFYSQGGYDGFLGPQEFPTTSMEETSFEGGDQPHNNMQPYMALNYMMKVQAEEDVLLELQEAIDEQSQLLSSLQNQQTPLTSSLTCVDMGVGQNCPDGLDFGTYSLTPNGQFGYPIDRSCECDAGTTGSVTPDWRKFEISGMSTVCSEGCQLLVEFRETCSSSLSCPDQPLESTAVLDLHGELTGALSFYLYGSYSYPTTPPSGFTNCQLEGGGLPQSASPSNALNVHFNSGYAQWKRTMLRVCCILDGKVVSPTWIIDPYTP